MFDSLYVPQIKSSFLIKEADDKILNDPASWDQEVIKAMYESCPYLGKYNTVLQWHKKDEQAGYAYGSIVVQNSLIIPAIISHKGGRVVLYSLDVFNYNGKWYPLNNERVEGFLFNHQAFDRLTTPQEEVKGTNRQIGILDQPPDSGREILASARNILDFVLPSAEKEDIQRVINEIDNDESILSGFTENGTFGQIRKVAEELTKDHNPNKALNEQLPVNVVGIEKKGNNYQLSIISDNLYRPDVSIVDVMAIRKVFGDDIVKEASKNPVILEFNRKENEVFIVDDIDSNLMEIEKSGNYTIDSEDGEVYTDVYNFDLEKTGKLLFTNGKKFSYQDKLAGIPIIMDTHSKVAGLEQEEAALGDWVSFKVKADGLDKSIVTSPIKLANAAVKSGEGVCVSGEDAEGHKMSFIISPDVKTFVEKNGTYYIPEGNLIRLGERFSTNSNIEQISNMSKVASRNSNTVDVVWSGMQYTIRGTDECKLLDTENGMDKHAAKMALVKLGSSTKQADIILKRASQDGRVSVSGLKSLKTSVEINKTAEDAARKLKQNTVKLAAMMPTDDSVDKVLALNFINPQNLRVFIDYIPSIEDCLSNMCSLLVASRIGLKEIDEYAVKTAITLLEKVTADLKNMFSVVNTLNSLSGEM